MEEEKNNVYILSWPKETAHLDHEFKNPAKLEVRFEKDPANISIEHWPAEKMNVDMNMNLQVRQPVPVCIRLCEPICAKSDYKISINFLDRPIGSVIIKGMTRLFTCTDNETQEICVRFSELKEGMEIGAAITYEGLTFTPVSNPTRVVWDDSVGVNMIMIPYSGIRIDFPYPVDKVSMKIFSMAEQNIQVQAFAGSMLLKTADELLHNGMSTVEMVQDDTTSIVLSHLKEGALAEICYVSL